MMLRNAWSGRNKGLKVLLKISFFSIIVIFGAGTLFSNLDIRRRITMHLDKLGMRLFSKSTKPENKTRYGHIHRENISHAPIDSIYAIADGFEPDVVRDFPSVEGAENRIPRIMHQMWISDENDNDTSDMINVPTQFEASVKSFFNMHSQADWNYMFWDSEKARSLISERYKWFLAVFDSYMENIIKGDVLRYIVLYEFGGVYADLDLTFLRPLNRVTVKYPCVLTLEPFEHPVFNSGQPYRINNNLIFCRPKHPFMKYLIDNLPYARMMVHSLDISGPSFISMCYLMYSNISKDEIFHASQMKHLDGVEPFLYKGRQQFREDDSLYLANTQYFSLPVANADNGKCSTDRTSSLVQRMCAYLKKRSFVRTLNMFTFTKHAWANSNVSPKRFMKTVKLNKSLLWNKTVSN
ncbi:uncharacterized protein LOC128238208 [Mya arenaria]|uniref:uncharacterized protein LOC128238208 n=1 Tax=Mya arenaria TaxID=6604 RepID=UPI0022E7F6CA|nr:uncharacterized protein LOC128238208 [Mya arenaria]